MSENNSTNGLEPIKVFIRVRPEPDGSASTATGPGCLSVVDETTLQIAGTGKYAKDKVYTFTEIFREPTTQDLMYAKVAPLVSDAVHGYNTAVFSYGAISSGKTYTIIGNKNEQGIMPRAIRDLFQLTEKIQAENPNIFYFIEATYVEIYNNKFRNLLKADDNERIDIHESTNLGVFLTGGSSLRVPLTSADQATALISAGHALRFTRSRNKVSTSRGHGILTLFIERREISNSKTKLSVGSMNIVDLAGIEKLTSSSGSGGNSQHGELYIEAQSINSSLNGVGDVLSTLAEESTKAQRRASTAAARRNSAVSAGAATAAGAGGAGAAAGASNVSPGGSTNDMAAYLESFGDDTGSVVDEKEGHATNGTSKKTISSTASVAGSTTSATTAGGSALTHKKSMHIPYLNSKLTHYLKEALGGNCRTTMIFTLLPGADSNTSTVLMYAEWAMRIRHTVKVNVINTEECWSPEKDPEAIKLKTNLEVRSKETEEMNRRKLIGLNLPPPPTLEEVVVSELAETASELAALRRNSLLRQETSRRLSGGGAGVGGSESDTSPAPALTPPTGEDAVPTTTSTTDNGTAAAAAGAATADAATSTSPRTPSRTLPPAIPDLKDLELADMRTRLAAVETDLQRERGTTTALNETIAALKEQQQQQQQQQQQWTCPKCPEHEATIKSLKEINRLSTINMTELNAKVVQLSGDLQKEHVVTVAAEGRVALLESQLAALQAENDRLRLASDKEAHRVSDLESTLAREEQSLAAEAKQLLHWQQRASRDENALAELRGQLADLQTALTDKEGENGRLRGQLREGLQAVAEKEQEIARLTGSVREREGTIAELQGVVESLRKDKEDLQGRLNIATAAAESNGAAAAQKVDASLLKDAYTAKAVAKARADAAEEALQRSNNEVSALRAQLSQLQQQLEETSLHLETAAGSKEELERQNAELTLQVTQLRTQLSDAESSDEEIDTETVEVEQTITETEVVGEDGEIEIRREIVETTRTTKVHDLHHHSSKANLVLETSRTAAVSPLGNSTFSTA